MSSIDTNYFMVSIFKHFWSMCMTKTEQLETFLSFCLWVDRNIPRYTEYGTVIPPRFMYKYLRYEFIVPEVRKS